MLCRVGRDKIHKDKEGKKEAKEDVVFFSFTIIPLIHQKRRRLVCSEL
jgi:hypothetical protein